MKSDQKVTHVFYVCVGVGAIVKRAHLVKDHNQPVEVVD